MHQGIFKEPRSCDTLKKDTIILRPYWQYLVKRSGMRQSRMCCNGLKKSAPQLHAVASTWSFCVSLPRQPLFLRMCADLGLVIYGSDCTDAYAHSPAPNDTFLFINDAYANLYEAKFNKKIDWRIVLPVNYALQGYLESGKQ